MIVSSSAHGLFPLQPCNPLLFWVLLKWKFAPPRPAGGDELTNRPITEKNAALHVTLGKFIAQRPFKTQRVNFLTCFHRLVLFWRPCGGGERQQDRGRPAATCVNTLQQLCLQDNKLITSDLLPFLSTSRLPSPYRVRISVYTGCSVPDHPLSGGLSEWEGPV